MSGYFGRLEEQTLKNTYFRKVLFTGKYCQLVVMCLQPVKKSATRCIPRSTNSSASSREKPSSS